MSSKHTIPLYKKLINLWSNSEKFTQFLMCAVPHLYIDQNIHIIEMSTIYSSIFIICDIIQFKFSCHWKSYNRNYDKFSGKKINVNNWSCIVLYFTKGTFSFISVNFSCYEECEINVFGLIFT